MPIQYSTNGSSRSDAPYGVNQYGTPYRADGSPSNYGGSGDTYRADGGSQSGYTGSSSGSSGSSSSRPPRPPRDSSADARRALERALDDSVSARNADFDLAKQDIADESRDLSRDRYIERRRAERAAPERAAALGLHGGAADALRIRLEQSYFDAVERIRREQARRLAKAQKQRDDAIARDTQSYQKAIARL